VRTGNRHRARRILAALLAGICLPLAAPPVASAAEESENLWTQWWSGVTDRAQKAEIPFAFVVTLPAMIVVTPIWLVERAYARLSSEDDDDDS
jgi:uncharacterized paraquat-inducible protein A